ncbi:hypothetical protein [Sporocytophaga sp.]|uniref:hypothetical protein n=1 Tax=Sporocytophaga sp. TaxID=2231183 RepID=UPI0025D08552|nr:hypothetical protein [Sporocytophaga sp.]
MYLSTLINDIGYRVSYFYMLNIAAIAMIFVIEKYRVMNGQNRGGVRILCDYPVSILV